MLRQRMQVLIVAVGMFLASWHLAHAGMPGRVIDIDEGMVTIQTEDGEEHEVKIDGLQLGERVEYTLQERGIVTIKTSDGQERQGKAEGLQMSDTTECAEKNAAGECPKK